MSKRKLSSDVTEKMESSAEGNQKMINPFAEKKNLSQTERKEQQSKALTAFSKFLTVSDKYAKAWEKQKEQGMSSNLESTNKFFNGSLRDYQMVGVKWLETLYLSGINGILADEMGLGKTVQIIAFLGKLQTKGVRGMHLIIVPLSTIPNWVSEFKRFAPNFPVITYAGSLEEREKASREIKHASLKSPKTTDVFPIILVPHHYIHKKISEFLNIKFIYVIIDEGHRIKNHRSQMSLAVRQIQCCNKLLLTGTPLQNNMIELWSLLNFIMPVIFSNMEVFHQLIQAEDFANETLFTSNLQESQTVLQTIQRILEPFMLRRLKADVLKIKLPVKNVRVYCPLSAVQLELYSGALEKNIEKLRGVEPKEEITHEKKKRRCATNVEYREDEIWRLADEELETVESKPREWPTRMLHLFLQNPLMLYRRIVNHPYLINAPLIPGTPNLLVDEELVKTSGKMCVLDALLKRLLERGHKVLIFSTLVVMLDLIEDYLHMRDIPHARLTGASSLETRTEQIDLFNNDPDVGVFLISTRAGGQGINLTAADSVILYDSDWNPHSDLQAQARCHRIGQTKPVMVYTLVSRNTIDEYILSTGEIKMRLTKAIIKDNARSPQNVETMQELLESLRNTEAKIHPNGLTLSDEQLEALLDRSELIQEMADIKEDAK